MWQHPRLLSSRCVARKRCRPISKVLGLCKQTAQQDALGLPHPPTSQLSHCAGHHDWQFWGTGAGLLAADGLLPATASPVTAAKLEVQVPHCCCCSSKPGPVLRRIAMAHCKGT
jgi:hypothetical protein